MLKSFSGERIWIIGASSGMGRALAIRLAETGANLILSARDQKALDELKSSLPGKHQVLELDISDPRAVQEAAREVFSAGLGLQRLLLFSALYEPMRFGHMNLAHLSSIIDVNLKGVFHVLEAAVPHFRKQNTGQIALCASVSGYLGLPGGQPYSATKAAVINLAESLRAELPSTIDVKLINPGFVKTRLTDKNDFPMPCIVSAETAAAKIEQGLSSKQFEIHFPKRFTLLLKLMAFLPYRVYFFIASRLKRV